MYNHGHYIYKQQRYDKKIDIYNQAILNNEHPNIQLSFHDDIFSKIDWTQEPDISLNELYYQRAVQLRQQYDYLILMFSGGSDSSQVLNTFTTNKIHLDEVITHYPIKIIQTLSHNIIPHRSNPLGLLYEFMFAAAPRLKQLSIENPSTKITIKDMSYNISSDNSVVDFAETYLSASNQFHILRVIDQIEQLDRIVDDIKNKTVGVIYGSDKPSLLIEDDHLLFAFDDSGRTTPACVPRNNKNYQDEFFFWSEQVPLIPVKQSHIIKKQLEKSPLMLARARNDYNTVRESDWIKQLIYPSYDPSIYQQWKLFGFNDKIIETFVDNGAQIIADRRQFFNDKYYNKLQLPRIGNSNYIKIFSRRYDLGMIRENEHEFHTSNTKLNTNNR